MGVGGVISVVSVVGRTLRGAGGGVVMLRRTGGGVVVSAILIFFKLYYKNIIFQFYDLVICKKYKKVLKNKKICVVL
jgi:hypothetical protein